ncbi:MAG: peptidoglycan DD-metalloendopeptidase family protein [Pseudolabrys sp.]|nr:peptidoglycan DD-metalloendopeptidase family protein [Pseudolabrys sp.]MDP2296303.1 peptidoglycan DD-metalloendopeptidase family protein [Pseudolabrys sp.]
MPRPFESLHSLARPRAAALALIGLALAGCSNSGRFDTPYASNNRQPAPQQRPEYTGSIAPRPAAAPTSRIVAQPLPTPSAPATVAASSSGYSTGAKGLGAYRPGAQNSDITGSVATQAAPKPAGGWTWDGGSPVTVGYGESVEMIARKHGVPAQAILETNGITNPASIKPGQRLVIPRYISSSAAAPAAAPRIAAPAQVAAPAAGNVHIVAPGESLMGIARKNNMTLVTLARANNIEPYTKLNIGDRITIPGGRQAALRPAPAIAAPAPTIAAPQVVQPRMIPMGKVAAAPAETARMATQEPATTETAASGADAAGAMPSFRWPVQGRIIAGFGAKANGVQNDGINLAVPEGTPIKAAEDGVVAYAGNELKGYGNLVLIRHANGFVSAYANAKELLVKRGDSIKRGQVIANAGQTGNVTSPQLHFEIRKGSTPVDPTKYLSGSAG